MNDKYLLGVLGIWITTTVLWLIGYIPGLRYGAVTGLIVVGGGIYYISERKIIQDTISTQNNIQSGKAIEQLDHHRLEEALDDYSKKAFSEDKIDVRWDVAEKDMADLDRKGEEALVAVTGALGQNDQKIQVFIHIPTYNIPTQKRIRGGSHQEKYPFEYSDYYQEHKQSQISELDEMAQQQQQQQQGVYYQPMQPTAPRKPPQQNSNNNEDDGDE